MMEIVVKTQGIPFQAARQLIDRIEHSELHGRSNLTRAATHKPPSLGASFNDKQEAKGQFRWRGRKASTAAFMRWAATTVAGSDIGKVSIYGPMHLSDWEFFQSIATLSDFDLTINRNGHGIAPLSQEDEQVLLDLQFCREGIQDPGDWDSFATKVIRYLQCGDSWTATWLCDWALDSTQLALTDKAVDVCALAYEAHGNPMVSGYLLDRAQGNDERFIGQLHYSRAMLLTRHLPRALQSISAAEDQLRHAASLMDENPSTSPIDRLVNANALALVLGRQGRRGDAVETLERAIAEHLDGLDGEPALKSVVHANLGVAQLSMGDETGGLHNLDIARTYDPGSPEVLLPLVRSLIENQDYSPALQLIEDFLARFDEDPLLLHHLALARDAMGDAGAALRAYEQAANVDPLSYVAALNAARAAVTMSSPRAPKWLNEMETRLRLASLDGQFEASDEDRFEGAVLALQYSFNQGEIDSETMKCGVIRLCDQAQPSTFVESIRSQVSGAQRS